MDRLLRLSPAAADATRGTASPNRNRRPYLLSVLFYLWCASAPAAPEPAEPLLSAPPLSAEELADFRGGFVSRAGLEIAFSFAHFIAVDGSTLLMQRLPEISLPLTSAGSAPGLDGRYAQTLPEGLSALSTQGGLLLQNTMNGRTIDNLTVINMNITGLQQLGALPVHARLVSAAVQTLR